MDRDLLLDVSAASAAYLFSVLPQLMELPQPEAFDQLTVHFEAAVRAYLDGVRGWIPEPSEN